MFYYTAFGLQITSELEFPELFINKNPSEADVHIRMGLTPKSIEDCDTAIDTTTQDSWITPKQYLRYFKGVAWLFAENGNLIVVQSEPNAELKSLRLYLLCNAMPAIIHQRGFIPFHASGVICKDGVALIIGHGGAGKSTTIKALTKKGHKIFTDDVCVLKNQENKILAIPSYPMMKLWEHSFDLLQLENKNDAHRLKSDINKYGLFFHDQFVSKWMPVIKVFNIVKSEDADKVSIKKQQGIDAFKIIGENTYRSQYVEPMKLNSLHFKIASALLQQCELFKITRPAGIDSVSEIVEIIETELILPA